MSIRRDRNRFKIFTTTLHYIYGQPRMKLGTEHICSLVPNSNNPFRFNTWNFNNAKLKLQSFMLMQLFNFFHPAFNHLFGQRICTHIKQDLFMKLPTFISFIFWFWLGRKMYCKIEKSTAHKPVICVQKYTHTHTCALTRIYIRASTKSI